MSEHDIQQKIDVEKLLRSELAGILQLPVEAIGAQRNLLELGVDSLSMMRLAARLRRNGIIVSFAQLIAMPSLASWIALLEGTTISTVNEKPGPDSSGSSRLEMRRLDQEHAACFALAPMQYAYWIGRKEGQAFGGVTSHFYVEFDGEAVDPQRLEQAVHKVMRRHDMLRMRVTGDDAQEILGPEHVIDVFRHDFRQLNAMDKAEKLIQLRRELSTQTMDLTKGKVLDIQLTEFAGDQNQECTRTHISLDMIAADALSLRVLLRDLAFYYSNPELSLPPLSYSYRSYLADRDLAMGSASRQASRQRARDYWLEKLKDMPEAPELPLSSASESAAPNKIIRRHCWLDPDQLTSLENTLRAYHLTLSMGVAAIFAEILSAWSNTPDFLLNLPLFDREPFHEDVNTLVGDFTSSVLLAWEGASPGSYLDRALRFQERLHADVANSEFSGVEVLRELSKARGRQVLAPVVYTSAIGLGELFSSEVRGILGSPIWIVSQGPQVWLDVQMAELDGGLLVNWDAREEAFAPGVLDAMFSAYKDLLGRLSREPSAWLQRPYALAPKQQIEIRCRANEGASLVESGLLHEGFFEQARVTPFRTALCWAESRGLTYGQLAEQALRIAGGLILGGIKPEDVVAVSLPKGVEQIAAVLGILAAGAAYLPIGVDQPEARKERILESASPRARIVEWWSGNNESALPTFVFSDLIDSAPLLAPVPINETNLAYVIYTSGSTGAPKGVEIIHGAAWNTIADINRRFGIGAQDRVLAVSALDFDLSVYDIFGLLSVGGAVVLIDESSRRDAAQWGELIRAHQVTVWNTVPTLLEMLLAGGGSLGQIRLALVSGDWVPLDLLDRLRGLQPNTELVALGGATEASIWSNFFAIEKVESDWKSIPYGKPLSGQEFRVVDILGRDCPDWVAGELWIGGAGVARGYRGAEDLTAAQFVKRDGRRWYRTGDFGRYWPDGTLEFLGRADQQVKVRGHRIELGEIEVTLSSHATIRQAIVLLGYSKELTAIVVVDERVLDTRRAGADEVLAAAPETLHQDLRAFLKERLPVFMVPERYFLCDSFPLTTNGKVDRKFLRTYVLEQSRSQKRAVDAPFGAIETLISGIWKDVLGVSEVGRGDNFFLLGGDSLSATRIVARLQAFGAQDASLPLLFTHPILSDFAVNISTTSPSEPTQTQVSLMPDIEHRYQPFPLTDVQRSYWLGRREGFLLGGVGCHFYREYEIDDMNIERLEEAVNILVDRHEMLRAIFDDDGLQRIQKDVSRISISREFIQGDPSSALSRMRERASHRVFDPLKWPLFSIEAVQWENRTRLGVGIDNLVADALSVLLFYEELEQFYENTHLSIPAPELSFRDYLLQVVPDRRVSEKAKEYWQERIQSLPPSPQLPLAIDPSKITKPRFVRYEHKLQSRQWESLCHKAREHHVTPSAVLLSAFAEVLSFWSVVPELTITTTLFDRQEVHPEIYRVIGDFTSLMLISQRPGKDEVWSDVVRRIQGEMASGLEHRSMSAVQVLREVARQTGQADVSMPVVFTSALGMPSTPKSGRTSLFDNQVWGISQTPQVWLDHQILEENGVIHLHWDVVAELFPQGMIGAMFAAYLDLISQVASCSWSEQIRVELPAHQAKVRKGVNDIQEVAAPRCLHKGFFEWAHVAPDRQALKWSNDDRMTYGELADLALRFASAFAVKNVKAQDIVAISLPKGAMQIAAVLGVLAVGASYLPIGVDQPLLRKERIVKIAGAKVLVTEDPTIHIDTCTVVTPAECFSFSPMTQPEFSPEDSLAYVIFTSGSTGEPKGVEVTHRSAWNTIADINNRFEVSERDSVLAVAALDFDLSVYDIFGLLSVGGALVLIEESERRDALRWGELIHKHSVTVWNSVPTLMEMLLSTTPDLSSLRLALVSGDWVPVDMGERLRALKPNCRLIAMGGATEASIWSNFYELQGVEAGWSSIPYGRPLAAQKFRVVDFMGFDRPDWVKGELWIGGAGVARGYRGAPEVTAQQFVIWNDERWYRTGDYGRYWPDGTLEFLGRADRQIKLRGHRIELGEIESSLSSCPGIRQGIAFVLGDGARRQLIAAVVPELLKWNSTRSEIDTLRDKEAVASAPPSMDEEYESRAIEVALSLVLDLGKSLSSGRLNTEEILTSLEIADEHQETVRLWMRWLHLRSVLITIGDELNRGPCWDDLSNGLCEPASPYQAIVKRAAETLTNCTENIRDILKGNLDPTSLLTDEALSPASLVFEDPRTQVMLDQIVYRIRELYLSTGQPVNVVELGGRDGRTAEYLLETLRPEEIRYTMLDSSPILVALARERLQRFPHAIKFSSIRSIVVPPDLMGTFDLLVANQSLHRYHKIEQGVLFAQLLLKPNGIVLALESRCLTPLGLVLVGLLERGFVDHDFGRHERSSPMLAPEEWSRLLHRHGYVDIDAEESNDSGTFLLFARKMPSSFRIDEKLLHSYLSERLPIHMIPERIYALTGIPLNANGKVDRSYLIDLLVDPVSESDGPINLEDETELEIAQLWSELLELPVTDRSQNFFLLGGDSLHATRMIDSLYRRFNVRLPMRRLFAEPTLSDVASAVREETDRFALEKDTGVL